MREIKFRMYDTNKKEYVKKIHDNYTWWDNGELMCIQEPLILEQYTGLKDKNGSEIYEGDVLKCFNDDNEELSTKYTVIYCIDSDYPAFDLLPSSTDEYNGLQFYTSINGYCEIVGNIHEI